MCWLIEGLERYSTQPSREQRATIENWRSFCDHTSDPRVDGGLDLVRWLLVQRSLAQEARLARHGRLQLGLWLSVHSIFVHLGIEIPQLIGLSTK